MTQICKTEGCGQFVYGKITKGFCFYCDKIQKDFFTHKINKKSTSSKLTWKKESV